MYDKRRVDFMNLTGTVYLNAVALNYHKSFFPHKDSQYYVFSSSPAIDYESLHLSHDVKDQMRVEVVRNVDI